MSKRVKLEFDERSLVSIDRLSEQGAIMAPLQKHTEGPWHVWNEQFPRIGPTHNCTVAGVFACPVGDQQANAKLLAAAPEMLEALKSAMQCLDDFVGDGPTYRMVKAAIAKAEGTSVCDKCGDSLTGHEDDSRTRCRWCVTGQAVDASAVAQASM